MASYLLNNLLKTKDTTHYVTGGDGRGSQIPSAFANYVGTDYILFTAPQYPSSLPYSYSDNEFIGSYSSNSGQYGYVLFPFIPTSHLGKIEFDFKLSVNGSAGSFGVYLVDNSLDTSSSGKHIILYYQSSPSSMSDYQHYEISVPEGRQDIAYSYLMLNFSNTVKCNIKNMAFLSRETSNGGGATHIAKVTGQLKDLSSNLSDILMVSGGGGGGLLVGDTGYSGKEAGGISGSGDNSADQTTGNAFGLGESGTNVSGGGSGLYGGYKSTSSKSGGAGSGYIGNSLLSNKKMVGYNVPTSSSEGTKTESVNDVSASAVSGKPKSGNGFARIKLIKETNWHTIYENGEIKDSKHLTTDYTITDTSEQSITTKNISFTNEKIIINADDTRQGASRGFSINFINSLLPQTLKQIRLTMKVAVNDGGFGGVSYALLKNYPDNYLISNQFNGGDFVHGDAEYIIGDNSAGRSYSAVSTDTYLLTNISVSQNDILRILINLVNYASVNLEITKIEYHY